MKSRSLWVAGTGRRSVLRGVAGLGIGLGLPAAGVLRAQPSPAPASAPPLLPPVAPGPQALAARQASGAQGAPVFVLNSLDATVSVIDARTWTELRRVQVGKEPHHLYLTPDERSLMVANALGDSITLIDPVTGQIQRTIEAIVDPYHLRFSPDMKWFVTAANRLNHIDVYRWKPEDAAAPLQLVRRIPAARTPSHMWIDSRSTVAWVSLQDSDELIAIDLVTQAPRWRIPVGRMPADVYVTPDDRLLFIGLTGDRFVEVYDVSGPAPKRVQRIETGAGAHAFRSRGDRRHLFVSNRVANTISLIDTQTLGVVFSMPAPGGPDCMDLLSDGRTLLVTSRWARRLTVIDTETRRIIQQVPVGRSPHGVWSLDHASRL